MERDEQIKFWRGARLRPVIGVAVIIRVLAVVYLFFNPAGIFSTGDSIDYHKLGVSILNHGTFSKEPTAPNSLPDYARPRADHINYDKPLDPDYYRTPAYPFFLALVYGAGGGPFAAIVVQGLFSLLLVWLIAAFTLRLFGEDAAVFAGWMAAVEPLALIHSNQLMSDTLFVLLFLAAMMIFMDRVLCESPSQGFWAPVFGGFLMGLGVLTRPVGLYVPVLLAVLALVYLYTKKDLKRPAWGVGPAAPLAPEVSKERSRSSLSPAWRPVASRLACFILAGLLTVSVWAARNYVVFDRLFISTSADHNLLITITSQIVSKLRSPDGTVSRWQIRDNLEADLIAQMSREGKNVDSPPDRAAYFRDWSIGVIKSHPGLFALYFAKGAATLFVSDITGLYQLLGLTSEAKGGWGTLFQSGPRPALAEYFGPRWPLWVAASAPVILYDLAIYALAFVGTVKLWRAGDFFVLFFFISIIGYWIAVSAIGAMPRYRLPMMPFLISLAAAGAAKDLGDG